MKGHRPSKTIDGEQEDCSTIKKNRREYLLHCTKGKRPKGSFGGKDKRPNKLFGGNGKSSNVLLGVEKKRSNASFVCEGKRPNVLLVGEQKYCCNAENSYMEHLLHQDNGRRSMSLFIAER
jgi:hypothetical protein